jgi:energy-coupling factor transporter ATP-binding protein EcfA2
MLKRLYAFVGKKGSGKNTAAEFLAEIIQDDKPQELIIQFAFADILKAIINDTFNISQKEEEVLKRSSIKPFNGLTLREVYQKLAENIKVYFGEDVWSSITMERVHDFINDINSDTLICTDLRYPIEEAALKKFCEDQGLELIIIKTINLNLDDDDNHVSETNVDLINYNYKIEASDIYQIKLQIEDIYQKLNRDFFNVDPKMDKEIDEYFASKEKK